MLLISLTLLLTLNTNGIFSQNVGYLNKVCGLPGARVNIDFQFVHLRIFNYQFEENCRVRYFCNGTNVLLIGRQERTCLDGRWTQMIPFCASQIEDVQYEHQLDGSNYVIKLKQNTSLAGIEVDLTEENITEIYIDRFHCKKLTSDFVCESLQDIYLKKFKITSPNGFNTTDSMKGLKFYRIGESSECNHPDYPSYAYPHYHIAESDETLFRCAPYFHFDGPKKQTGAIGCDTQPDKIPVCIPNDFCLNPLKKERLQVILSSPWNETYSMEGGQIIYSCTNKTDIIHGHTTRTCINRKWTGQEPICVPDEMHLQYHDHIKSKDDGLGIFSIILIIFGITVTVVITIFLLLTIKKRNKTIKELERMTSIRSKNDFLNTEDHSVSNSNGIVGKRFKMSYKSGGFVDDYINMQGSRCNSATFDGISISSRDHLPSNLAIESQRNDMYPRSMNVIEVHRTADGNSPMIVVSEDENNRSGSNGYFKTVSLE